MKSSRSLILIFDMLAGHWNTDVRLPATGYEPPNVRGYSQAGLIPAFTECIREGVFVEAWNRGICNTPYGQKYLASGTYSTESVPGNDSYWKMLEGIDRETILNACKRCYPQDKVAAFGSDAWMQTGWWKAPDCTMGWGSYYSDFLTMQHAFNWMTSNPDWKMVLLYLSQYDMTGFCPAFKEGASFTGDKHHSLLQLDRYLWTARTFLEENGWWNNTHLCIGSDHGCHYGCDVAVPDGKERGVSRQEIANYCSNHQPPYDCCLWDFDHDRPTDIAGDCCRRVTFIISGGALDKSLRGTTVTNGEIIDFPATIADLMEIDFHADGKSVLSRLSVK